MNAKPPKLRLTGLGPMLAVPIFLLLASLFLSSEFERTERLREQIDHSYRTRGEIRDIFTLHQDIETGQRGYILTGDEAFLAPYRQARRRISGALDTLDANIPPDSPAADELTFLRALSTAKLQFTDATIRARGNGGTAEAYRMVASGRGKALMDRIRVQIDTLDADERGKLAQGTEQARVLRERSRKLLFGMLGLFGLLLFAAAWLNYRTTTARDAALRRVSDFAIRQESIYDNAKDGMIILDKDGYIESLNPAASRLYGYPPEELIGRGIEILGRNQARRQDVQQSLALILDRANKGGNPLQEFAARRKDGSGFTADVATSPVPLTDGMHFLAVVRDVTERKEVEQMKTAFVSTVSHELRTPLTSIAGSLGLLSGGAAGALPERAARLIKIAHANSERLVRLINDILDVEKIESGKMSFNIEPVPLRPLVEQAIQANQAFAADYGVNLVLEAGNGDAVALADADRLMQVVTNLLSNAAKFSPRGEVVTVTILAGQEKHRIVVSDKGSGIPDEFKSRIFSKFAQADASDTRIKGGTGLGLSIVREIVTRLGGMVDFETRAGGGTSFYVDLPAAAPVFVAKRQKPRILICQDDAAAADEVKRSLRYAGFDSDVAGSGDQVRMLAARMVYTLVLLDLTLSGEQSIALIRHLRADPRYASVPIVVTAPDGATGEVFQSLAVVDWLPKPYLVDDLVKSVADAINGAARPCILHVEDDVDVLRVVASAFEEQADLKSVTDLKAARAALKERHYDLVILDLELPEGSGLELLSELRREDGTLIPVVIFSAQDDDPEIAQRVEAILTKSRASLDDLVGTVTALIAKAGPARNEESR